ncbi:hypothetical protein GFS31_26000 [Leptolyngbya sp. BL0902]|nr:hypothetical protein GFS31_26000 [Leptolyngbya sp. BL0902]
MIKPGERGRTPFTTANNYGQLTTANGNDMPLSGSSNQRDEFKAL